MAASMLKNRLKNQHQARMLAALNTKKKEGGDRGC